MDTAIGVWMCGCEALIVKHFKMATGQKSAKSNAIHSAFTVKNTDLKNTEPASGTVQMTTRSPVVYLP